MEALGGERTCPRAGISANQPVSKAYTLSHYALFSPGVYVFVF